MNFSTKNPTLTNDKLLSIGNNVASLWGGSCYNVSYNKEDDNYIFECIEHGEKFLTILSPKEIEEELQKL